MQMSKAAMLLDPIAHCSEASSANLPTRLCAQPSEKRSASVLAPFSRFDLALSRCASVSFGLSFAISSDTTRAPYFCASASQSFRMISRACGARWVGSPADAEASGGAGFAVAGATASAEPSDGAGSGVPEAHAARKRARVTNGTGSGMARASHAPDADSKRYSPPAMAARSPITVCGSLSLHPVSLGAAMHGAAYEARGLPWLYAPFAVERRDLEAAVRGMRALSIRGLGVSMPFKIDVVPLLDVLAPLAARIGAVNTIVNDDRLLTGHNTDAEGAARALEETVTSLRGARCLVLGAGGAARAVAFGLADRGADVAVAARTDAAAAALAGASGASAIAWSERAVAKYDVLVNATSAGMDTGQPPTCPMEGIALLPSAVVLDIVYKPLQTPLLRRAKECGARTIDGGRMLLHQAARQFELYTGEEAPLDVMDAALRRASL